MTGRSFIKMHGLGNDFVVVDARTAPFAPTPAAAAAIADRRRGVGCDQLLILEPPTNGSADVFMRIRNADGGEVAACGNGTRCVAALLFQETGRDSIVVETAAGLLPARTAPEGVTVNMGPARSAWQEIPLAREMDTLHLDLGLGPLRDPVGVNMGNPHAVFFVEDLDAIDIADLGPKLEHDALFPERANIGVAQVIGADALRLRVWERGVGLTLACGSGACAAGAAALRRGLTGRRIALTLDGGQVIIEVLESGDVLMTGPASTAFTGSLPS